MTFQKLCKLVMTGTYNYYSKQLEIIVEPKNTQIDYAIYVWQDRTLKELVEIEPTLNEPADSITKRLIDKIEELKTKYIMGRY
jgi:hypothetical protein